LKNIIAGEPPYDLFIRWKGLANQAIGWNPDINDGVRLNCRPFVAATLSRGKKGAGLFRGRFNVKWEKDRGKEPLRPEADFPWFWKWDEQTWISPATASSTATAGTIAITRRRSSAPHGRGRND